jgi:hypothetical protein
MFFVELIPNCERFLIGLERDRYRPGNVLFQHLMPEKRDHPKMGSSLNLLNSIKQQEQSYSSPIIV